MNLLNVFLERETFTSYEDFFANYHLKAKPGFNFAYDVVDTYATQNPNKRAIVWCNELGDERIYSFRDVAERTNQTANYFKELGIQAGDRVMLILKRRIQYWSIMMALHKLGATAIPATFLLSSKDVSYRCDVASIKMIIAVNDEEIMGHVDTGTQDRNVIKLAIKSTPESAEEIKVPGWVDLDSHVALASKRFGVIPVDADSAMLGYFSSGTAGNPKLVLHNFYYPLGHIVTARYWQQCIDDGLHLTVSDSGWGKCVWGKLYGQWISGSAVMVFDFDKFDAAAIIRVIKKYQVSTFCVPPTIYRFMIKTDLNRNDWLSIRHASTAGEPLNPEVYRQFKGATGLEIAEGFGQTETVVLAAMWPWLDPKPGSMGKPAPSYHVEVHGESGKQVALSEEGELVVNTAIGRPIGLFMTYWQNPVANEKAWTGKIYHTGDAVRMDEEGYLWFTGRRDDLIKSSGYRISPFEVESVLMEHPAVLECAVTGTPDTVRGIVVKASIILTKGVEATEELKKKLQAHVKSMTAPYKYPRVIDFVSSLPKTISDKIRRVAIREKDKSDQENASTSDKCDKTE